MRESLFLLRNGVNIYENGTLQAAPWNLALFAGIERIFGNNQVGNGIFLVIVNILISAAFFSITKFLESESINALSPAAVAKCHLYNPLSFLAVFGLNFGLVGILVQLAALASCLRGFEILSALLAGFAVYSDFYSVALVVPMILCFKPERRFKFTVKCLIVWLFLLGSSDFLLFRIWSVKALHPFSFINSVYLSRMRIDSLRPNSGLNWYLFTQVFPVFRPLLKISCQIILMVFWPACVIKFNKDPMFMLFLLVGSQAVLKGYPSVSDNVLFFGLLMTQFKLFEHTRILFLALFAAFGVFAFKLQIWRYWIELPGFNVNFYYISTLIWNVVLIIIILDILTAYGKYKIFLDNPIMKDKKLIDCKLFQR